ncbi:hypothetical protein BDF14DRAFT_1726620 [Spinellus fusiger]|nr:hypothetical protein BDF14DRAFT_1726620 [Spinellus fusiger]
MYRLRLCRPISTHLRRFSTSTTPKDISEETRQIVKEWKQGVLNYKKVTHDTVTASPINLLANTLNTTAVPWRHEHLPPPGTEVPPTWHHLYFPPRTPEDELAHDGYETDLLPPAPFVHRMWKRAQITFSDTNPLRVGQEMTMTTTLDAIDHCMTSKGEGVFVDIKKDIHTSLGLSISEVRRLVYLTQQSSPTCATDGIIYARRPEVYTVMTPSQILLFRYSALTFNAHLIHYDHSYSTEKEHYEGGCLVHGPLSSTLLMNLLQLNIKEKVKLLSYRCLMPLYVHRHLTLCMKAVKDDEEETIGYDVWILNNKGRLAVKGYAEILEGSFRSARR